MIAITDTCMYSEFCPFNERLNNSNKHNKIPSCVSYKCTNFIFLDRLIYFTFTFGILVVGFYNVYNTVQKQWIHIFLAIYLFARKVVIFYYRRIDCFCYWWTEIEILCLVKPIITICISITEPKHATFWKKKWSSTKQLSCVHNLLIVENLIELPSWLI